MKHCCRCGEDKPFSAFGANKRAKDGLKYQCRACDSAYVKAHTNIETRNKYSRDYYAANRLRERTRCRLARYKLSAEEYASAWATADGKCEICRTVILDTHEYESGVKRPANAACIDHDHGTGKVRGLLCTPCNLVLGYVKDNPAILSNAIRYLITK